MRGYAVWMAKMSSSMARHGARERMFRQNEPNSRDGAHVSADVPMTARSRRKISEALNRDAGGETAGTRVGNPRRRDEREFLENENVEECRPPRRCRLLRHCLLRGWRLHAGHELDRRGRWPRGERREEAVR